MIVATASLNKVIPVSPSFMSVAIDVIERRCMPPTSDKVLIQKTGTNPTPLKPTACTAYEFIGLQAARSWAISALPRCIGFFSATKVNLRNAP